MLYKTNCLKKMSGCGFYKHIYNSLKPYLYFSIVYKLINYTKYCCFEHVRVGSSYAMLDTCISVCRR